jgi:hypothetical protein
MPLFALGDVPFFIKMAALPLDIMSPYTLESCYEKAISIEGRTSSMNELPLERR